MFCTVSRAGRVLCKVVDACITVQALLPTSCHIQLQMWQEAPKQHKRPVPRTATCALGLSILWVKVNCEHLDWARRQMPVTWDFSVPSSTQTSESCLCMYIVKSPFSTGTIEKTTYDLYPPAAWASWLGLDLMNTTAVAALSGPNLDLDQKLKNGSCWN
ncbi:hypothetical protein mRhiFer1_010146 [Rhinolophus ferrumequinum]|uniref:Uncharacterized protein n=1 Tax=Rhinolophus ferrumequinum TaxID=59479 RepID=A0A7J7XQ14_RHIFE|nr:hypothetical protein mRhiFer1_010146 [Rhinolophus ferrumequinum]